MTFALRYSNLDKDSLAEQCAQNFRDIEQALRQMSSLSVRVVEPYSAAGDVTVTIPVFLDASQGAGTRGLAGNGPRAVLCTRALEIGDPGADPGAVTRVNFTWDAATGTANVFEPNGLTSGTNYRLVFLVVW